MQIQSYVKEFILQQYLKQARMLCVCGNRNENDNGLPFCMDPYFILVTRKLKKKPRTTVNAHA
jgi:hypothetical protein